MTNGEALMDTMEPTVEAEAAPQEEAVPEPTVDVAPPPPAFDPSVMVNALDAIHGRMDSLEQQTRPPDPTPTEEELMIKEVASKLGLDKVQEENAQLKQALEQMQQQGQQMQSFMEQQQITAAKNEILSKYDGITEEMVVGKLHELAAQFGEDFANGLNNSKGWEFVISTQMQGAPSKPDPIVSTESGNASVNDNISERVAQGDIRDGDLGMLLMEQMQ